jgi:hypothetical protein
MVLLKSMSSRLGGTYVVMILMASFLATACSSNLTRFDVVNKKKKSTGNQVTRYEAADQGSGDGVANPGGHYINKLTVGGSYLRRNTRLDGATYVDEGAKAPGGHSMSAGLHGNMRATR